MFYKEDEHGQILEEGITEAGSISSFIAAGTSYSAHDVPMVPFYIYYSMFGYQRVGDLVWAAGDSRTRGFLLGGTAGRTTLNGEGLQHEDGHSHVLFSVVPNCRAYDPAFGYEVAVIIQDGPAADGRRAGGRLLLPDADERELPPPADARGRRGGHPARHVPAARGAERSRKPRVQLLGSGTILHEVLAAAELLEADFGVAADVWSVTSFTELRRDGIEVERWNMLHPEARAAAGLRGRGARRPARPGDRLDRLHPRLRRPDPPVGAGPLPRARDRRLRPQRLPRARCGASSRSTATTSPWPRCSELADRGRDRPARVARGDRALRDRPRSADARPAYERRRRAVTVEVPDIGDFDDVPIIEILVSAGDRSPPRIRSSRSSPTRRRWTFRLRSPGTVGEIQVKVGDRVSQGIGAADASSRSRRRGLPREARRAASEGAPAEADGSGRRAAAPTRRAGAAPRQLPAPAQPDAGRGGAATAAARSTPAPSVRRLARELGVDLTGSTGSGPQGPDHHARTSSHGRPAAGRRRRGRGASGAAASGAAWRSRPWPKVDFEKFGPVERVAAHAHPEDLGPEPGPQLGDDPPRHPPRRGRHHRPRGLAQAAQRGAAREGSRSRWSPSWSWRAWRR